MRARAARITAASSTSLRSNSTAAGPTILCFYCHELEAGHPARIWLKAQFDANAALCGACGAELTIREYLDCQAVCPACRARFRLKWQGEKSMWSQILRAFNSL